MKGLAGGSFNVLLAVALGQGAAGPRETAGSLVLGAFSYGLSLVLFIAALRELGSARTSVYFSAAPLFGAAVSVALLGERPSAVHWLAAAAMAGGLGLLSRESHGHVHTHEPMRHGHPHGHDDGHHAHGHEAAHAEGGPHDHPHEHQEITHSHVHWPDTHHRH